MPPEFQPPNNPAPQPDPGVSGSPAPPPSPEPIPQPGPTPGQPQAIQPAAAQSPVPLPAAPVNAQPAPPQPAIQNGQSPAQPWQTPTQGPTPQQYTTTPSTFSDPTYSPPNNKRKLLLGAGAAGVLVLLIAGGLFAFNALGKVTPEQYRQAASAAADAETKLSTMSLEVSGISYELESTDVQLNNQLDKAKKSIADYKTAHTALDGQKALKDRNVSKLYKEYESKQSAYLTDNENYYNSMVKLGPVMVRCSAFLDNLSSSSSGSQLAAGLTTCSNELKGIQGLPDKEVQAYTTATQEAISQYASFSTQLAALGPRDYTKRSALLDQLYAQQDIASKKIKDIESTIDKRFTDKTPRDELRKVSDELFNKSLSGNK